MGTRHHEPPMMPRHPRHRHLPDRHGVVDLGGCRPRLEPVGQCARAGRAGDPQRGTGVVNPHVRPQYEHAQARKERCREPALADDPVSAGRIGENAEDREHAALGRAPGGDAGCRRVNVCKVRGELPLKPREGIAAGNSKNGEEVEIGDRVSGQHRNRPPDGRWSGRIAAFGG